jgi:membrane protein implicated in regulation of membrane protease activity
MSAVLVWTLIALLAVGAEVLTVDLTFALIAVGAGAAAVASALGAPLWLQGLIGIGVSLAGILLVRPIALRHLRRMPNAIRTGVDALPGTTGKALSEVTADSGRMSLRGEVWSARLDPDVTTMPVATGTPLVVTRIDGATALVHPVD